MRGERVDGRFSIDSERKSIISGTTKDLVRTVGNQLEWWFFDHENTVVDEIYDVGYNGTGGGRKWLGPMSIPVITANLDQGVTVQNDRGFYNTDVLMLTINMDVIDGGGLTDGAMGIFNGFKYMPTNPDAFLRDRIVYKNEVFKPVHIDPRGILTENYTLFGVECHQVNAEEMINDLQFQEYANYTAFGNRDQY